MTSLGYATTSTKFGRSPFFRTASDENREVAFEEIERLCAKPEKSATETNGRRVFSSVTMH